MRPLKKLVHEMHRRSLWQVLGIFAAASWGVLQVVDLLTEQVGLPDWTPTMALVLLLIGLPIVLATAFVQEGMSAAEPTGALPGGSAREAAPSGRPSEATPPVNLAAGTGSLDRPSTRPSGIRRLLTWRNAILGGMGAFTLLGLSIFTYFVMWTSGVGPVGNLVAQGVFEEGELLVLADFEDGTGANLGDVVTEAIRVDLQESEVINLVPPAYVSSGLARMGLAPDAPFTAATARELAVRDGLKAVVQGEVARVGSGFLLTASLVAAESGAVLKAFRIPVTGEDELLSGIDKLSQEIREKSGESLRSIRGGAGLEEATTSSLDALRLYTDALKSFDADRQLEAIPLLEESLELDPEFAMAWRKLAVVLNNQGLDASRVREASRRAYELRRRLTDREAGLAEAWYLSTVEDNPEAAIDSYLRLLERYPDDGTALNNVAVRLLGLGRWEEAEAPLRRVVTQPTPSANSFSNFIQVLWNVGKREEARAWRDSLELRYPDAAATGVGRHWLLGADGRWDEAHDVAEGVARDRPSGGLGHLFALADMAGYDLAVGRYAEAMDHLADARRNALESGAGEVFYQGPAFIFVHAALALEGREGARRVLAEIERDFPLDSLGPRSSMRPLVADWRAMAGESVDGQRIFDGYERAFSPEERGRGFRFAAESHRAAQAWGRSDWEGAVTSYARMHVELQPCGERCILMPEWGVALDEAGRAEEALEKYAWYLADTQLSWHGYVAMWTPLVLERTGRIHEARGEIEEASDAYRTLIERFGEGDGPFVGFVERARVRLASLGG